MWSQQCLLADYFQPPPPPPPPYYQPYHGSSPSMEEFTLRDLDHPGGNHVVRPRSPNATGFKSEHRVHDLTPPASDHGDEKQFTCGHPKCAYVTNRRNNLKRHVMTMHERLTTPYQCCGFTFFKKADMRIHNKESHRDGYVCNWQSCGKLFLRKALLDRHKKIHTGEKPYICIMCNYGTSHKSNLERHMKIHYKLRKDEGDLAELVKHAPQLPPAYGSWNCLPALKPGRHHTPKMTGWPRSALDPNADLDIPLPDSTTADAAPPSPSHFGGGGGGNSSLDLPQPSSPRFQSLLGSPEKLGFPSSLPVCDLASITSILLSPIKTEVPSTDDASWWPVDPGFRDDFLVPQQHHPFQTLISTKEQARVSHTIDNILGI